MDWKKLAIALVGFCILTLILLFLNFGAWSAFIAGILAITYLVVVVIQATNEVASGFMRLYAGIKEDALDWWHMPSLDELARNPTKETMPFGTPMGEYWYLTYFDEDENEQYGAIINKNSEVLSKFISGMSPKQAINMFMERKQENPYGNWFTPPHRNKPKQSFKSDMNDVENDLHGGSA